jgi:hypothetical protein
MEAAHARFCPGWHQPNSQLDSFLPKSRPRQNNIWIFSDGGRGWRLSNPTKGLHGSGVQLGASASLVVLLPF